MTINLRSRKDLRIENSRLKLKCFLLLKITDRLLKIHTAHKCRNDTARERTVNRWSNTAMGNEN